MSFLSERKAEIIEHQYKSKCCKRAFAFGVLFCKATVSDGVVSVRVESLDIAERLAERLGEVFSASPVISTSKSGGRGRVISFISNAASKYIASLSSGGETLISKCPSCFGAFLSGVFLACGRASDPKKQYRLELAPTQNAHYLRTLLEAEDIKLSYVSRRNENILYTNNSAVIEDFFARLGLNKAAFMIMDEKIKCEFATSVRRLSVCETNNIEKAVDAANRQCRAVEAIMRANLLSSLPDELELTARMRIKYPDYTLSRLAAEFTPPISKPGLAHRLNRLIEIAENIKN